ncbi:MULTISPECIES: glycosyltransferase family 29 protein [Vibrio]|uniref:glycosyltransferase family 29 protein n=1 Tax=Vibrio TaxID=662 RepID=UPI001EE09136|nr:glycosyltransferase family 29 protein [Vibrio cincinnatiensis]
MTILTPFDLISRFDERRSVIFVGNAPSLKGEMLGEWIDSHDIVVRFNNLPPKALVADVGNKTSILVTNPYIEERGNRLEYDEHMLVIALFSQTRRGSHHEFEYWLNNNSVIYSYSPDIIAVEDNKHYESLSTGTYGIQLLSRVLKPSVISVTGFTMFLQNTKHHYWSNLTPSGIKAHDFEVEAKIFINIINGFRAKAKLYITEDISWVAKKSGIKIKKKNTEIRKLNNDRWRNESRSFWNFRCR